MFCRLNFRPIIFIVFVLAVGIFSAPVASPDSTLLVSAESDDGQCQAYLEVSPIQPFLSDTITLTLNVFCSDGIQAEFPPFAERIGELKIIDIKESEKKLSLTVIPQRSGKTPIWGMTIRCGQQEIRLPAAELDIAVSMDSQNASLESIGLSAEPIVKYSGTLYIGATLLVIAALILLWLFLKRKKEFSEEITPITAKETALKHLQELLKNRKQDYDIKGFFVELSDIVRWYVEQLTGIHAPELTTEEFLHQISSNKAAEFPAQPDMEEEQLPSSQTHSLEALVPFLESTDIVKFAQYLPAQEEIMLAFRRADAFIRQ